MEISKKILLLGDPRLYEISREIKQDEMRELEPVVHALHEALMDFRAQHQRGRAIAAPQLGVELRLIYMHIDKPVVFINPEFIWKSAELIEVWDDCFSFPELLVKVHRHKACRVKYRDLDWKEHVCEFNGDLSELFQHEYDHLDGILAVMRAVDGKSFAWASQKHHVGFTR
jgi:peptide deformylase